MKENEPKHIRNNAKQLQRWVETYVRREFSYRELGFEEAARRCRIASTALLLARETMQQGAPSDRVVGELKAFLKGTPADDADDIENSGDAGDAVRAVLAERAEGADERARTLIAEETAKPIQRSALLPQSELLDGNDFRHFLRFDEYYELAEAALEAGEAILGPAARFDDELAWWAVAMRLHRHSGPLRLSPSLTVDRMTAERAARLEALPGWRWNGDDVAWNLMLNIFIAAGRFSPETGVEVDRVAFHQFLDEALPEWSDPDIWDESGPRGDWRYYAPTRAELWIYHQMRGHVENRLTADQRLALQRIPGWNEYLEAPVPIVFRFAIGDLTTPDSVEHLTEQAIWFAEADHNLGWTLRWPVTKPVRTVAERLQEELAKHDIKLLVSAVDEERRRMKVQFHRLPLSEYQERYGGDETQAATVEDHDDEE